jgi:predicted DNA-binding transcriptional regulator AlpA
MPPKNQHLDQVRTREEFAGMLGISLRTLCRMEQNGEAPPRVQISATRYGYRQSVIDKFLNQGTRV